MESNYEYVIKVCYNYRYELIFLNDISVDIFLNACKYTRLHIQSCRTLHISAEVLTHILRLYFEGKKAFKIDFDKAIVELSDRDNATIPKKMFKCVVEKRATCDCFCINLKMLDTSEAVVTPSVSFFA